MNIYVGNLSFDTTEDQLRQAFEGYGEVTSVKIVDDQHSGRSRGFGFVEMSSDEEGQKAIDGLNGQDMDGRELNVNQAKPRERSGNRSGGNQYKKSY
jgi:RNA recognition motif-containing protein